MKGEQRSRRKAHKTNHRLDDLPVKLCSWHYLLPTSTPSPSLQICQAAFGVRGNGACDGCIAGLADMYQDYIDGKREIRDINMSFRVQYESGDEAPERTGCGYNSF